MRFPRLRRATSSFGIVVIGVLIALAVANPSLAKDRHARHAALDSASPVLRSYEQHALTHPGDPRRGRDFYHDETRTKCDVCHKVGGRGGDVGPDLSNIGGKFDRPHLIESLLEPSRQIVEGFRTTIVTTTDGQVLTGIVKNQDEQRITLADATGQQKTLRRDQIDVLSAGQVSIMPEDLTKTLSVDEFTDLVAYLETLRPAGNKMGAGVVGPISLPKGFEVQTVTTGLSGATALDVLSDGRVLVCEQTGAVRVIEKGRLLQEPFLTLPVDTHWERGLIGVTHHPKFPQTPYIYVCWVAKKPYPHHRVSRFTAKGNVAVEGSEKLLLTGDDQTAMGGKVPAGHQGGALHFGADGKLYIGIGEQTAELPAQRLDTFLGKILRINADGSIPDDNPFIPKAQGKYQAIWARGARNPFTFAVRPSDGLMLINDVGGKFEEINVGRAGANYGWPVIEHGGRPEYEGDEFDGPIHWYPQSSVNGADFCPERSDWPKAWQDRYFFADFVQGWIKALNPDNPKDVQTFGAGFRRPVDMRFTRDGDLYVLLRNAWVVDDKFQPGTGSLLRIRYAGERAALPSTSAGELKLTTNAVDESAGGLPAYKIETPLATYFLEKTGAGLSSMIDKDGNDWLGFHPEPGSREGGEYRGFPNAVHRQAGSYFHPKNDGTDASTTQVEHVDPGRVTITAESGNGMWACRYVFVPTHCTFTMTRMPAGNKYWVLYEGTPGGRYDKDDWWMTSAIETPQPLTKNHESDIAAPEWIAFGDKRLRRSLYLFHHEDDSRPDRYYQMGNKMTVFGFGRQGIEKFLDIVPQQFSIGFVEHRAHNSIGAEISSRHGNQR